MPRKLTQQEVEQKIHLKYPNNFHKFSVFEGTDKSFNMTCRIHNYYVETTQARRFYQDKEVNPCDYCRALLEGRTIFYHTTETFCSELTVLFPYVPWNFNKTVFTKKKELLTVSCIKHGDITKQPDTLLRYGCTLCKIEKGIRSSSRWNKELVMSELSRLYPGNFLFNDFVYKGYEKETIFYCVNKHELLAKPINILKTGCKFCKDEKDLKTSGVPLTKQKLIAKLKEQVYSCIFKNLLFNEIPDTFKSKDILTVNCSVHTDNIIKKPYAYLRDATVICHLCAIQNQIYSMTTEEFIERIELIWPGKYSFEKTVYIGAHNLVIITCKKCNKDVTKVALNFLNHEIGCTSCSILSKPENELFEFIKQFSSDAIQGSRPKWMNRKQLDIYIPSLKLAVEYNGNIYHHSSKGISKFLDQRLKTNSYHLEKYELCKQNGINLIHIFEFEDMEEWKNKLKLLIQNPDKYCIGFENVLRDIDLRSYTLSFHGKSEIILKVQYDY